MKKFIFGCILLLLGIMFLGPKVSEATDWIKLNPEDVISQAECVVTGTYDLTDLGDKLSSSKMWIPFEFKAERYYKGSGGEIVQTAIQPFDIVWVRDFQAQGGSFVLFLEKDHQDSSLLLPVGGVNGMVQVLNGSLQNQSAVDSEVYNRFLRKNGIAVLGNPLVPIPDIDNPNMGIAKPEPAEPDIIDESKSGTFLAYFAVPGVIALLGIALIVWKLRK